MDGSTGSILATRHMNNAAGDDRDDAVEFARMIVACFEEVASNVAVDHSLHLTRITNSGEVESEVKHHLESTSARLLDEGILHVAVTGD